MYAISRLRVGEQFTGAINASVDSSDTPDTRTGRADKFLLAGALASAVAVAALVVPELVDQPVPNTIRKGITGSNMSTSTCAELAGDERSRFCPEK